MSSLLWHFWADSWLMLIILTISLLIQLVCHAVAFWLTNLHLLLRFTTTSHHLLWLEGYIQLSGITLMGTFHAYRKEMSPFLTIAFHSTFWVSHLKDEKNCDFIVVRLRQGNPNTLMTSRCFLCLTWSRIYHWVAGRLGSMNTTGILKEDQGFDIGSFPLQNLTTTEQRLRFLPSCRKENTSLHSSSEEWHTSVWTMFFLLLLTYFIWFICIFHIYIYIIYFCSIYIFVLQLWERSLRRIWVHRVFEITIKHFCSLRKKRKIGAKKWLTACSCAGRSFQ